VRFQVDAASSKIADEAIQLDARGRRTHENWMIDEPLGGLLLGEADCCKFALVSQ